MDIFKKKYKRSLDIRDALEKEIKKYANELFIVQNYSDNLVESIKDALVITDSFGKIKKANNSFNDFIYHSDIVGTSICDYLFDLEDQKIKFNKLKQPVELSCHFKWKDEKREILSSWCPILNHDNTILNIFLLKDVTEINSQLRGYANFTKLTPSPVLKITPSGEIVAANDSASFYFEINENLNWFNISQILNPESVRKLIDEDLSFVEEIVIDSKTLYFQYKGVKIDQTVNLYGFDVTEEKKKERKIKKLQDELIDQAYNQGVAENSIHVLHNIGNVLTSIIGRADAVKRNTEKNNIGALMNKVCTKLEKMEFSELDESKFSSLVKTLKTLSNQLNDFEKTTIDSFAFTLNESLRISDIISTQQKYANKKTKLVSIMSLKDLLSDLVTMHEYRLEKRNIDFKINICRNVQVEVEKVGFSQTLSNAIINAIEAIDEKYQAGFESDFYIHVNTKIEDGNIILSIVDNGIGIEAEKLSQIFKYGFSTKKRGSGFGLHNCANFMKNAGGKIELFSEGPNEGTETRITIPLYESA